MTPLERKLIKQASVDALKMYMKRLDELQQTIDRLPADLSPETRDRMINAKVSVAVMARDIFNFELAKLQPEFPSNY